MKLEYGPNGQLRFKGGRSFAGSPEAKGIASTIQSRLDQKMKLADAEVDAEESAIAAEENQAASDKAFAFAKSVATSRRPVGGGIERGGAGMATLNAATGGLTAANQKARKTKKMALRRAQFEDDPEIVRARAGIRSLIGAKPMTSFK